MEQLRQWLTEQNVEVVSEREAPGGGVLLEIKAATGQLLRVGLPRQMLLYGPEEAIEMIKGLLAEGDKP